MDYGKLLPVGGGDPIPLLKEELLLGRQIDCDICLRFNDVSAHHCQMSLEGGYWFVKDMSSRNGTTVNGSRVSRQRLDPGDILSVAKHRYEIRYWPGDLAAAGPQRSDEA